MGMGCSGRSFAVEGSRRVRKKKGLYFWAFLAVGRNGLCMGCSGRSFAVEGFRRRNRLCMEFCCRGVQKR